MHKESSVNIETKICACPALNIDSGKMSFHKKVPNSINTVFNRHF